MWVNADDRFDYISGLVKVEREGDEMSCGLWRHCGDLVIIYVNSNGFNSQNMVVPLVTEILPSYSAWKN